MVLVEEKTSDIIKKELLSYDYNELEALMVSLGEPKYRASQIFPQMYRGRSPEEIDRKSVV